MNTTLAPVVITCFDRLDHLKRTIDSLLLNEQSKFTNVYIFQDGVKPDSNFAQHSEVYKYLKTINGFKKITINQRKANQGLALNITEAVSEVLTNYEQVIVLEDDICVSKVFLKFMNDALCFYQKKENIMCINGYVYPIKSSTYQEASLKTFFTRIPISWGWGTYRRAWKFYEKNVDNLLSQFSNKHIYEFNFQNSNLFWNQVLANRNGKINSWAVFWYASIFKHSGLCLTPSHSLVQNIGHDGSGVHCAENNLFHHEALFENDQFIFNEEIKESPEFKLELINFFKKSNPGIMSRVFNKLKNLIIRS